MIETLLPTASCSEMFSDAPEWTMFSVEAEIVADAVDERRREFGTVRACARQALREIGVPPVPILPDADGVPHWPAGVVGSMTHCPGYRAAVVARTQAMRSVGIDAEVDAALPAVMHDLIMLDEERAQLDAMAESKPERHWDRILFCAKEAVFKAWFPVTRTWLDYADVSVTLHPDNAFSALVHAYPAAAVGPAFVGRWTASNGIILAVTWIRQSLARAEVNRTFISGHAAAQSSVEAFAR